MKTSTNKLPAKFTAAMNTLFQPVLSDIDRTVASGVIDHSKITFTESQGYAPKGKLELKTFYAGKRIGTQHLKPAQIITERKRWVNGTNDKTIAVMVKF